MISIVCTYHNRKSQFITTLNTIKFQIENSDLEDVEVICVNHNSGEENNIDDLPKDFNFLKVINLIITNYQLLLFITNILEGE